MSENAPSCIFENRPDSGGMRVSFGRGAGAGRIGGAVNRSRETFVRTVRAGKARPSPGFGSPVPETLWVANGAAASKRVAARRFCTGENAGRFVFGN